MWKGYYFMEKQKLDKKLRTQALRVFFNKNGLLSVKGRLQNSLLS